MESNPSPTARGSFATTIILRMQAPLPLKKVRKMPTKGYRKGISDKKEPVPHSVRTHVSSKERAALAQESDSRAMPISKLLRALVIAHITNCRAELPHPRKINSEALRELCRTGNNLNQLARQANTGIVPLRAHELRAVLDNVLSAVQRLG